MATAHSSTPNLPLNQEIIDVDSFDDDVVFAGFGRSLSRPTPESRNHSRGSSTSLRRNEAEIIVLSDSEDEVLHVGSSRPRRSNRERSRLISPPPPRQNPQVPPPVPALHSHIPRLHRHTPSHPNSQPPPAILPNAQPFAFESSLHRMQNQPPNRSTQQRRTEPRASDVPVVSLGGALLSMNRSHVHDERNHTHVHPRHYQQPPQRNAFGSVAGFLTDMLQGFRGTRGNVHHVTDWGEWPLDSFDEQDMMSLHFSDLLAGSTAREKAAPMWKSEFTHPGQPQSGFTFDFSPEEPGAQKPTAKSPDPQSVIVIDDSDQGATLGADEDEEVGNGPLLVCAHCLSPLLVSEAAQHRPEEDRKDLRVWALRCGHLLDGKCIQTLMRPSPVMPTPNDTATNGKRKAEEDLAETTSLDHPRYGKGKGRVNVGFGPASPDSFHGNSFESCPYSGVHSDSLAPSSYDAPALTFSGEAGSIRSRLRPRPSRVGAGTSHPSYSSMDIAVDPLSIMPQPSRSTRSLPRRRGGALPAHPASSFKKGKGRARKAMFEEEYEWLCPVEGCGHRHRSVRLGGGDEGIIDGWSMALDDGALSIFV